MPKNSPTGLLFSGLIYEENRGSPNNQSGSFENLPFSSCGLTNREAFQKQNLKEIFFRVFGRSLRPFTPYDSAHERTQPIPALPRWRSRSLGFQDQRFGEFFPVLNRPLNGALESRCLRVFRESRRQCPKSLEVAPL